MEYKGHLPFFKARILELSSRLFSRLLKVCIKHGKYLNSIKFHARWNNQEWEMKMQASKMNMVSQASFQTIKATTKSNEMYVFYAIFFCSTSNAINTHVLPLNEMEWNGMHLM